MFGGNSGQLKQMMQQMGIDFEELDVEDVVIRTEDGEELVFDGVTVNRMHGQGQEVYQIMGEPTERRGVSDDDADQDTSQESSEDVEEALGTEIEEDDVELVALRANVSEEEARDALEQNDGDLAAAISSLQE